MKDGALKVLVNIINGMEGGEYGITLTVGGVVVSGTLIPNTTWMREVAELHPLGPDGGEGIRALFTTFEENLHRTRADEEALQKAEEEGLPEHMVYAAQRASNTEYIHIKRAMFMGLAEAGNPEKSYWRGRLKDVTGWSPGTLGPAQ